GLYNCCEQGWFYRPIRPRLFGTGRARRFSNLATTFLKQLNCKIVARDAIDYFACDAWLATCFHSPPILTKVSVPITVRARCSPLSIES
ncbi:MAG: hypothetical protein JWN92_2677, partial [Candidatus Acidoferrum typicum]|nr:hypothetical protein [Candidatus Acidoferrum typicum]